MAPEEQPRACERARTWAALAPDGELSQLELRLLEAHLGRCASCARVARDIEAISEAIRSAPLEPPPGQISLPVLRRRSRLGRLPGAQMTARLAAVAAVGLLAFTMGSWSSGRIVETLPGKPLLLDAAALEETEAEPSELRAFRRSALLRKSLAAEQARRPSGPQPL